MVPNKVLILPEPVFSPVKWGNNTDLVERRHRVISNLCLIKSSPEKGKETRNKIRMVRRCRIF